MPNERKGRGILGESKEDLSVRDSIGEHNTMTSKQKIKLITLFYVPLESIIMFPVIYFAIDVQKSIYVKIFLMERLKNRGINGQRKGEERNCSPEKGDNGW